MNEILNKLSAVSGMLQAFASMNGCVITQDASDLLLDAVEMLVSIGDELKEMEEAQ